MFEELEKLSDEAWSLIYSELADDVAEDFQQVVNLLVAQETKVKQTLEKVTAERDQLATKLGTQQADLEDLRAKLRDDRERLRTASANLLKSLGADVSGLDEEDDRW